MSYLAITQPTASWLLQKSEHIEALSRSLPKLAETTTLTTTVLAIGALRASRAANGRVLALWNIDYLSNTGEESWGAIKLTGDFSLQQHPNIVREVFERQLYVINQRLQRLLLDERMIHHAREGGLHTCIAGRGVEAREHRIAYFEGEVQLGASEAKTVICFGPAWEDDAFLELAKREATAAGSIIRGANDLLNEAVNRPVAETSLFIGLQDRFQSSSTIRSDTEEPVEAIPELSASHSILQNAYHTSEWTYAQWTAPESPLTGVQRRILDSNVITHQPVRIVGAAGSGKTLLMMLLALRRLHLAREQNSPLRVLYIVHNSAMQNSIALRFITLGAEDFLDGGAQRLEVRTLIELSREMLGDEEAPVIHADAHETKQFQLQQVREAITATLKETREDTQQSALFSRARENESILSTLASLIADEIAIAIKGHGLSTDRKRYIESERRLSRFHGLLSQQERGIVFDCFAKYHRAIFEDLEVFDSDDLALSLLARLHTPIWDMRRKKSGYYHVFVDETQLFNENERKIFPLLAKAQTSHVPVVLALDEAQQTRGATSAGLGLLGFTGLADEKLTTVHRCTASILKLAFFVIQRTTDLFGPDFPDFTTQTNTVIPDDHDLAAHPRLTTSSEDSKSFGRFVLKQVRALRRKNIRQVAVICHSERHWQSIQQELQTSTLPVLVLTQRGERIQGDRPLVVLSRPETIGGQEFDAVIATNLEQGVVPPRIEFNQGLSSALEQQALREMYVSFTRARYRLIIVNTSGSAPTSILQQAVKNNLLTLSAATVED